ncbi:MAG: sulfate/thiosulfate ABC transporter permease CysW, partial [Alphaproteobacteria bacterium]|nr:sulfate/thiosulfate ABC transporter permease CysW [Alphaproteobacteria bacterium]
MATKLTARRTRKTSPTSETPMVQGILMALSLLFMGVILLLPLYAVFHEALIKGPGAYFAALVESDAQSAIRLTLLVAAIAVPLNLVFGVAASWAIAKFEFKGKA